MRKKELDLEKLGKISGGSQSTTDCKDWQKARDKEAIKCCDNCYYWVQDENAANLKYKCLLGNKPKLIVGKKK